MTDTGEREGVDGSGRPGSDHHVANTTDHVSRSPGHAPGPSQAISGPRRLTITVPGDRAEAVQLTNGVIVGFWDGPQELYAWSELDAVREQWPDAEITWIDPDTGPVGQRATEGERR